MCGRYSQSHPIERLTERFGVKKISEEFRPRYNIAPTQRVPVIVDLEGPFLDLYRWGLIPSWSKDPSVAYKMINARGETVNEKPSFREPFRKSRVLIPACGWFEWKKEDKSKTPYRITMKSGEPFAFAGIADSWLDVEKREIKSFSIITTAASENLKSIHERMPMILRKEDEALWLNPGTKVEELMKLIAPYPSDEIEAFAVSEIVNSARNETPECMVGVNE